jgi:protein tyrosine phosphatase (PTP) superfamily phosphohydrolase (DUF442 family)
LETDLILRATAAMKPELPAHEIAAAVAGSNTHWIGARVRRIDEEYVVAFVEAVDRASLDTSGHGRSGR